MFQIMISNISDFQYLFLTMDPIHEDPLLNSHLTSYPWSLITSLTLSSPIWPESYLIRQILHIPCNLELKSRNTYLSESSWFFCCNL